MPARTGPCPEAQTVRCSQEGEGEFDIVAGCDVTYDPKMFQYIMKVLKINLCTSGIGLICHDNDSCPLSKFAHASLKRICAEEGLHMEEIDYSHSVQQGFHSPNVHLWRITKRYEK